MSEISAPFELAELCTARGALRRTSGAAEPRTRCRPSRAGESRASGRKAHGRGAQAGRSGGPGSRGEGQASPQHHRDIPAAAAASRCTRPAPATRCAQRSAVGLPKGGTGGGTGAAKRERHRPLRGLRSQQEGSEEPRKEEPKESKEPKRTKGRRTREYPAAPPHPQAAAAAETRGREEPARQNHSPSTLASVCATPRKAAETRS